jgi:catechol 2,3-dioxygenase-like lactoylglutathione lyase family enzyme
LDFELVVKLGRKNHVGVATPSIERSVALYRDLLGATEIGEPFDLPAQEVRVCFVDSPNTANRGHQAARSTLANEAP